jgi:hypothetical protein
MSASSYAWASSYEDQSSDFFGLSSYSNSPDLTDLTRPLSSSVV